MKRMISGLFAVLTLLMAIPMANAAETVLHEQNFNTVGTSAAATLPTGWRVDRLDTRGYSSAGTATTNTGDISTNASAANGIYNFGSGSDRALGWLSSSSATKRGNLYYKYTNNTGSSINSFNLSYNVEKYRNGSNPSGFSISLYYSLNDTSYTEASAGKVSYTADSANNGTITVPLTARNDIIVNVSVPNGQSIYFCWSYGVTTGTTTSNAQALGVDDVVIKADTSGGSGGEPTDILVESVSLNKSTTALTVGQKETLTAIVTPENATNKAVSFTSSDTSIASVNSTGEITAVKAGTATITVTTADGGKTAECAVNVTALPEESGDGSYIEIAKFDFEGFTSGYNDTSKIIGGVDCSLKNSYTGNTKDQDKFNGTASIRFNPYRSGTTGDAASPGYIIINEEYSEVKKIEFYAGMFNNHDNGSLVINLYQITGPEDDWSLVTTFTGLKNNSFDKFTYEFPTAQTASKYKFEIERASGNTTTNKSANIDDIIFYKGTSGVNVPVTGVTLSENTAEIMVSDTDRLTAIITPESATNKNVTWESSDTAIATVSSNGTVTAVSPGNAVITAKTVDGEFTASCNVTVVAHPTISIAEARELSDDTVLKISGIISFVEVDGRNVYIQDNTAGILIYGTLPAGLKEGDSLTVTGSMTTYNGLKEVIPANVEKGTSNNAVPDIPTVTLSQIGEYQGQLIYIKNVMVGATTGATNTTTTITDASGSSVVYGNANETNLNYKEMDAWEGSMVNMYAISSCYNTPQLRIRKESDIEEALEAELSMEFSKSGDTIIGVNISDTLYSESESENADLIVAVYDSGALKSCQLVKVTLDGVSKPITLTKSITLSGSEIIKAFLWNSTENMKPLCKSIPE